jgi:hypothetical protein
VVTLVTIVTTNDAAIYDKDRYITTCTYGAFAQLMLSNNHPLTHVKLGEISNNWELSETQKSEKSDH